MIYLYVVLCMHVNQNIWKKRLVEPSPNDFRSAGLTKALHRGQVLSLSNLHQVIIINIHSNINNTQRTTTAICNKTTHHSETQSSQNMCLQRRRIGVCIFSWQMAHRSPAAFTCIHFSCLFRVESYRGISYIYI